MLRQHTRSSVVCSLTTCGRVRRSSLSDSVNGSRESAATADRAMHKTNYGSARTDATGSAPVVNATDCCPFPAMPAVCEAPLLAATVPVALPEGPSLRLHGKRPWR